MFILIRYRNESLYQLITMHHHPPNYHWQTCSSSSCFASFLSFLSLLSLLFCSIISFQILSFFSFSAFSFSFFKELLETVGGLSWRNSVYSHLLSDWTYNHAPPRNKAICQSFWYIPLVSFEQKERVAVKEGSACYGQDSDPTREDSEEISL